MSVGASGTPTGGGPITPAPVPSPTRRPRADYRAQEVERALIDAGLDAVTSKDFTAALIDVADALQPEAMKRSKPLHWLCELLADAADAVDPAVITRVAGDEFADALAADGMPQWAASMVGRGVANAAEGVLSSIMPGAQLCLGLRVLGMLVCPAPSACPVQTRLSVPLLKAALENS